MVYCYGKLRLIPATIAIVRPQKYSLPTIGACPLSSSGTLKPTAPTIEHLRYGL
ncbi:hypothetical protein H7F15_11190 [Pontibacter sp. Tf4]|uniref:hypothetical protein n=1 Tax=Pontibacter sp. Tf4 TaxID=2761620 RepID=UPI0016284C4C|nr:hypothetical protein [Pontibacter sp. Tf4]MBB6611603.1 hypothetical protein [Pontibacter sp. Tf4]